MPFGLAISTERAKALEVLAYLWRAIRTVHAHLSLQSAIQDELIKRGYSAEPGLFTITCQVLKSVD